MSTNGDGSHTSYLRLAFGPDGEENRNWALIDTKAFDLARAVIAGIPAGGDLTGFYPDPQIAAGAIHDADVSDVSFAKITNLPPGFTPGGPAGGMLDGVYPDPVIRPGSISDIHLDLPLLRRIPPEPILPGNVGDVLTVDAIGAAVWAPPGVGAVSYRHTQPTAATSWIIAHNLPFLPNVTVVDSSGREIWPANVIYRSATAIEVTFSVAVGGEAFVS